MSTLPRRLLALLLCACMLIASAAAEDEKTAFTYTLDFTMNASAYPAEDRPLLSGIADLVNMLHISGAYAEDGTGFDNTLSFILSDNEATRTDLQICGTPEHWWINSSLLGSETLMVNHVALLEFAMKAYAHLEMPLQYIALLVNPYVHTSAFEWILPEWEETFGGDKTRTVSRKNILALAEYISENGEQDRAFYYWVLALARDIGVDSTIFDSLYFLPDWAERVIHKNGVRITVKDGSETWTTGDTTLFIRTDTADMETWLLTLPADDSGRTLEAAYSRTEAQMNFEFSITSAAPGDILSVSVSGTTLPESFPFTGTCSLQIAASGSLLPEPTTLRFNAISDGYHFILTQTNTATGAAMLTLSGQASPAEPPEAMSYTGKSPVDNCVNILSVNDASLAALLSSLARPMITGAWPLLVQLPASSFASLFELLEKYSVLEMVINSFH